MSAVTTPQLVTLGSQRSLSLDELRRGDAGAIVDVNVASNDAHRLKALGVCAGRTVEMVSTGNPLIVRVLGSRVGLSASLAAQVVVQTC